MDPDHGLQAQVDLALANAKRVAREARIVVKDLARIRDTINELQSKEDISDD